MTHQKFMAAQMQDNEEIKDSLDLAMDKAGGSSMTWCDLNNMTAAEFLLLLAPNKIRFSYISN